MPRKKQSPQKRMIAAPKPNSEKESIGVELADFISKRQKLIVAEWEEAVRRDQTVPAAYRLTRAQLTDHIPGILTDLSLTLCEGYSQELAQDVAYTAAMHGQIRWQQDYDVSQLLREIGHLRTTLIHQLIEFQKHMPDLGGARGMFATVIVHSFLDRLMRGSVEEFVAITERTKPKK
jgi:RsbT co-antagonist protein rsbRD N-terminal domain